MLHHYNWVFKGGFGLTWCLLTLENYQKYKKGHTKARKGQVKNDYYSYLLCDHNWTFMCVFGLNGCQFTPENL